MSTINDVAKHAGVSVATVSKVLNNYTSVSDKTRTKVKNAIEALRYRPNVVARGLVKKRSWTIGMFLNDVLTNPFVAELLEGINQSLHNSGYDLIYLSMMMDDPNYSFIRHCNSRNVDGILIFGINRDTPYIGGLIHEDIPVMFIDEEMIGRRAGYITADNKNGILLAVEHLYGLGHRQIAFIFGEMDYVAGRGRFEGYQEGLKMYSLPYYSNYVQHGRFSLEGGREAMRNLLALKERPTAVICTSDRMALGAIDVIQECGLSVPGDLSVIGFDNTTIAGLFKPGLTTVNQNIPKLGRKATDALIAMIEDPNYSPPILTEPVSLVVRDSTGLAPETIRPVF